MIADHALAANCVLVTNNLRELARVEGLRVEDRVRGNAAAGQAGTSRRNYLASCMGCACVVHRERQVNPGRE
jgi:hypothetical protein